MEPEKKSDKRVSGSAPKRRRSNGTFRLAYIVPAVDRAARILSLLKTESREMNIAEIADATGWHKSSVHKLLVTLEYHGLLDRDPVTKRYSLGVALSEYGRIALNGLDVVHAAKSFLQELVDSSHETAGLAILNGTRMTLVDVEESPEQVRVSLRVGMMAPATTTSNGKAVLAYLPENRVAEIIAAEGLPAATKRSITKPAAFRTDLAATRKRGFATDYQEFQEGITGVSAPVFDSRGQVIGALSLAGPAFRMTREKSLLYGRKCAEMAAKLSAMLR